MGTSDKPFKRRVGQMFFNTVNTAVSFVTACQICTSSPSWCSVSVPYLSKHTHICVSCPRDGIPNKVNLWRVLLAAKIIHFDECVHIYTSVILKAFHLDVKKAFHRSSVLCRDWWAKNTQVWIENLFRITRWCIGWCYNEGQRNTQQFKSKLQLSPAAKLFLFFIYDNIWRGTFAESWDWKIFLYFILLTFVMVTNNISTWSSHFHCAHPSYLIVFYIFYFLPSTIFYCFSWWQFRGKAKDNFFMLHILNRVAVAEHLWL